MGYAGPVPSVSMLDGCPIEFQLTDQEVRDFCTTYNFTQDDIDGVLDVVKLYLCDLRKKILESGAHQTECFIVIDTHLLTTLGFHWPYEQTCIVHEYHNRATNLLDGHIVPGECVPTDLRTMINPDTHVYPQVDLTEGGVKGTLILSALQSNVDALLDDPKMTLVRCGYVTTCMVPTNKDDLDFIQKPLGVVLDYDLTRPYPIWMRPTTGTQTIQMFECHPSTECLIPVNYLRTLPYVINAVAHNDQNISVLVDGPRPLTHTELFGALLPHENNVRVNNQFGCTGLAPITTPSNHKHVTFWPLKYDLGAINRTDDFISMDREPILACILENWFNHPDKRRICLWLARVWDKVHLHWDEPHSKFVVLTVDQMRQLRDILSKDHISVPHSATSLSDETVQTLISFTKPAPYMFMRSAFLIKNGETSDIGLIINPLTYLPEGPDVYLFNIENLFKLFRSIFCENKPCHRIIDYVNKTPGHQVYMPDQPAAFTDFVYAMTDSDRLGIPLAELMDHVVKTLNITIKTRSTDIDHHGHPSPVGVSHT